MVNVTLYVLTYEKMFDWTQRYKSEGYIISIWETEMNVKLYHVWEVGSETLK